MSSFSPPLRSALVFSYLFPSRAVRRSCENQQHLADSLRLRRSHCAPWEGVTLRRRRSSHHCEGWSLPSQDLRSGSRVSLSAFLFFALFTLEGSSGCGGSGSGPEPPSTHPEDFLPARRAGGKSSPDVTSNKGKATGIEGGIRPIFGLTLRDPASSWHLSIFLLLCSLAEGSLVTSRLKGPFYYSFFLRLNSCLLPKKKKRGKFLPNSGSTQECKVRTVS